MQHICVVEDEVNLAEIMRMNLEMENFKVTVINDGAIAKALFEEKVDYDLIILDVMLPHLSGIDVCKFIRRKSDVPILFVSAKGTTDDRIAGLKAGGNDYLPKPFDLEEFLLRVGVLTQSTKQSLSEEIITIGNFKVNFRTYQVLNLISGEELSFTRKEILLLQLFYSKKGEVISRNEILDKVWGKDQFPTTRTIDNFILNFRKIFEENPKDPKYFHSIRGVGYKFTA